MPDLLSTLQTSIAGRLLVDPFFVALPELQVISEDQKDIVREIETRVAKIGMCVVVGEFSMNRTAVASYDAKSVLTIFERPKISRQGSTYKTGREVGIASWSALGDWSPDDIWEPFQILRWEPVRDTGGFNGAVRELELKTSIVAWPAESNDYFESMAAIMAPHINGGYVPVRIVGASDAYAWEFGVWQATLEDGTERSRLYAVHVSGSVVPVGVVGSAENYQWVFGEAARYQGAVENWAPHAETGIVPIRLVGNPGAYAWEFGVKVTG